MIAPLSLRGVTSTLEVYKLSLQEWTSGEGIRVDLTDRDLDWDPSSNLFKEQEEAIVNCHGDIIGQDRMGRSLVINSVSSSLTTFMADTSHPHNMASLLRDRVQVGAFSSTGTGGTTQGKGVDAPTLAQRWRISQGQASATVRVTTQRGVRDVTNPALSRRFPTNDKMLRYDRLPHDLFSDTMFAGTVS